jgi:hypothetical protein
MHHIHPALKCQSSKSRNLLTVSPGDIEKSRGGSIMNSYRSSVQQIQREGTGPLQSAKSIGLVAVHNDLFDLAMKSPALKGLLTSNPLTIPSKKGEKRFFTKEHIQRLKKKFRVCVTVVIACNMFQGIIDNVKAYGTSPNVFDVKFRSRKAVKAALYPDNRNAIPVDYKKMEVPFMLINPNSPGSVAWTILMFILI